MFLHYLSFDDYWWVEGHGVGMFNHSVVFFLNLKICEILNQIRLHTTSINPRLVIFHLILTIIFELIHLWPLLV